MSDVGIYKEENQLSRLTRMPGGRSVGDALRAAQRRIEAVRERLSGHVARTCVQLRELAMDGRAGDRTAEENLYAAANHIFALAGVFGMTALSQAAFSLCDLMTADEEAGVDWVAVDVHVNAIGLLVGLKGEADARKLVAGLRAISARPNRA